MGIDRHFTDAELQATRQYQQNVAEIRKEIAAVSEELDRRSGAGSRGLIYIV
ncbi:hypothetical protein [Variovorax paradoxus]|uniref:hypothetical protein n=1 Tax=Variovorax paradoxus TaxID=34073 RepID=UPI003D650132